MMTFWLLLAIAIFLSYLSLRFYNLLLSVGGSIAWLSLLVYNLSYPPTNITQGDTIHTWLTYGFGVMAIAVIFFWVRNRNRDIGKTNNKNNKTEEDEVFSRYTLMNETPDDYRRRVHSALHPRKR